MEITGRRGLRRRGRWATPFVLLLAALATSAGEAPARRSPPPRADPGAFVLAQWFFGAQALSDPAARENFERGMLNAFTFSPPLDSDLGRFLARHPARAILALNAATRVDGRPASAIERERTRLVALRRSGIDVSWNLMEEWDQAGGRWVRGGRPSYAGLTRGEAHAAFSRFYLDRSPPLGEYLRQPRERREVPLVAQTDFPMNAFYAFDWGIDVVLLERGIDELGDLSTGIAFARGAARQYGRRWGIDLSLWRTSNESATTFDRRGTLTGGWSPSWVRRHLYVSYLAGAGLVQLEPAVYYADDGDPNPLGHAVLEFADFALRRHPDVGRPLVPTAVMIGYHSGFDPKHWIHCQADAVWYRDIPYSDGDHMLDNFLKVAYPGHWLHGLTPGAPFASATGAPDAEAFRAYLRGAGDPRPYEPMPTTRWGDTIDVIADNAPAVALRRYEVIALVGEVRLDRRMREALRGWVESGGTLVVNVKQVTAADGPLLGVRLGAVAAGTRSTWLADGETFREAPFAFTRVVPTTAAVLATDGGGEPLATANRVGRGRIVLTTPHFLQSRAKDGLLRIGTRLLDWIQALHVPVRVVGAPVEHLVNVGPRGTVVTVVNHSGTPWEGKIVLRSATPVLVKEYVRDEDVAHARSGTDAVVSARVPPYDLKVYAFEAR